MKLRFYVELVVLVGLIGCGNKSHNLVGTWDIKGGPSPATITFKADGNFQTEATMVGKKSQVTGPYKLEGDKLTIQAGKARTATLTWKSDDEMIMMGDDGNAMTLSRKK